METECSGDELRVLAPKWSLAGDDKLLNILHNTHKNIITKCQEVNTKLEQMSVALDDASITLQNVNNKFLALSNSQFIESRVYDDDADVTMETAAAKETTPKPQSQESDVEMLKKSLLVLQDLHETVTILKDSDTETDSDGEDGDRVVLKPKDLYSERPLPYIIGSQAWKNSWHAGLIPEDSDTDSASAGREPPSPQYSDSEPEDIQDIQVTSKANATISETSSELASEQETPAPVVKSTPADIAADLARRLGGQQPTVIEPEPEYTPPRTASKTIYKPQQPRTGTIFTDEPPPLEECPSESSDDDIFAELHASRPGKEPARVADELFGGRAEVFPDYGGKTQPGIEQKTSLFEDDPDDFEDRQPPMKKIEEKVVSKKPVGGISVFGSNKGSESIGAAILKRNKPKSTSEEESDGEHHRQPSKPNKNVDQTDSIKKEKDIFEDLFAKSANLETITQQNKEKNVGAAKVVAKDKAVVDLFSDNLFDDVGDMFTTNVMKNNNKANQKSIFDDDDGDLFADIAVPTTTGQAKVENKNKIYRAEPTDKNKSLFDSDDELFSDKLSAVTAKSSKNEFGAKISRDESSSSISKRNAKLEGTNAVNITDKSTKSIDVPKSIDNKLSIKSSKIKTKSIFDSDSDSDIFSNLVKTDNSSRESKPERKTNFEKNAEKLNTEDILKNTTEVKTDVMKIGNEISNLRSPSLFDDDDDNLFSDTTTKEIQKDSNLIKESGVGIVKEPIIEKYIPATENKSEAVESEQTEISISEEKDKLFEKKESDILVVPAVHDNSHENLLESNEIDTSDPVPATRDEKGRNEQINQDFIHSEINTESEVNLSAPTIGDHENHFIEKDTLFQEQKDFISEDIFDDEPPVFEKPKEPKRSKNVNALFDDDSEDEALFFRSSDMDDKLENFTSTAQAERLVGILHDEPPAIDDFGKAGDISGIFDSVIPKSDIKCDGSNISREAITEIDDFENILSVETTSNIPKNDFNTTASKVEIKLTKNNEKYNFDGLFDTGEALTEIPTESKNKAINIHDAFAEIKENEFDDIFKTDSKIVDTDNDDSMKTSIDTFIKETVKRNEIQSNFAKDLPVETNMISSSALTEEKINNPVKSEIDFESDEELFKTLPKPVKPRNVPEFASSDEPDKSTWISKQDVKSDTYSALLDKQTNEPVTNKVKDTKNAENRAIMSKKIQPKDELIKSFENNLAKSKPDIERRNETENKQSKNNDIKNISRIKSLNLNIDVSTLLPGASPKKQKSVEGPKGTESEPPISHRTPEEVVKESNSTEKSEPKVTQPISFDGEPNSDILDSKFSKERARIQVKRRPSTRKARREAVRKSALDVDDSTDNSSSIDDPPKSREKSSFSDSPSKTREINISKHAGNENASKVLEDNNTQNLSEGLPKTVDNKERNVADDSKNASIKPKVTSKVVYILNDEDIFDTKPKLENEDNDLFKRDYKIPTLGNMYNTEKIKNNNKVAKKSTKASIFDSDSDEELFGGKSVREDKRVEVKGSLFGDDDDGKLFGVKTKTDVATNPHSSKTNFPIETEKSTEPVFNDPLSMLDDED